MVTNLRASICTKIMKFQGVWSKTDSFRAKKSQQELDAPAPYWPLIGQKLLDPWMTGFLKLNLNETSHTCESTHLNPESKVLVHFD